MKPGLEYRRQSQSHPCAPSNDAKCGSSQAKPSCSWRSSICLFTLWRRRGAVWHQLWHLAAKGGRPGCDTRMTCPFTHRVYSANNARPLWSMVTRSARVAHFLFYVWSCSLTRCMQYVSKGDPVYHYPLFYMVHLTFDFVWI